MSNLHETTTEAIRSALAESGASSPTHDTDTLAGLCATRALSAVREYAETHDSTEVELRGESGELPAGAVEPVDVADGRPPTEPVSSGHGWFGRRSTDSGDAPTL